MSILNCCDGTDRRQKGPMSNLNCCDGRDRRQKGPMSNLNCCDGRDRRQNKNTVLGQDSSFLGRNFKPRRRKHEAEVWIYDEAFAE